MKRKVAITILAIVLSLACVLAVGCAQQATVEAIAFKEGTVQEYYLGDTIDYSTIKIVATYSDGSVVEKALTDKGVTYNEINTAILNASGVSLIATYEGKSANIVVRILQKDLDEMAVSSFVYPEGYQNYLNNIKEKGKDEKQDEYYVRTNNYVVGNDNGFVFLPKATMSDLAGTYANTNIATTAKVYAVGPGGERELTDADLTAVISKIENNTYYFTPEAEGDTFKLEITLDKKYDTLIADESKKTLTITVDVVKGYNVYDAVGLSVWDNLNLKSWATLKDRQLDWDSKKLSDYTDVERVILHNNIVIRKESLPSNFFWIENEEAIPGSGTSFATAYSKISEKYQPYLVGSLKETYLGEDWEGSAHVEANKEMRQRAFYVSDGIGFSGNYLNVSVYSPETDGKDIREGGIYVVYDWTSTNKTAYPQSHWSLFKFENTKGYTKEPVVENVKFIGNTRRSEDDTQPAGIMMGAVKLNSTIRNIISRNFFTNIVLDKQTKANDLATATRITLNIGQSKFYDSFSNMFYNAYSDTIKITQSEMIGAGGPIAILDQGYGAAGGVLDVDDKSVLRSLVTGGELWFQVNNVPETIVTQLIRMVQLVDTTFGVTYSQTTGTEPKTTYINMIAVSIPEPPAIMDNETAINGTIKINGATYSTDQDQTFNSIIAVNPAAGSSFLPVFASGTTDDTVPQNYNYAYTLDRVTLTNPFAAMSVSDTNWRESWKKTHTDTLGLYVNPGAMKPTADVTGTEKHFLLVVGEFVATTEA